MSETMLSCYFCEVLTSDVKRCRLGMVDATPAADSYWLSSCSNNNNETKD